MSGDDVLHSRGRKDTGAGFRAALLVLLGLGLLARGSDDRPGEAGRDDRLVPLRAIVEEAAMEAIAPSGRVRVEPVADPIYFYDDPARLYNAGAIWAWGRVGRPVALMTLTTMREASGKASRKCEMTSLSEVPLAASIAPDWNWEPDGPGIALRPVPRALVPADGAPRRLSQMKEEARRFRAFERFAPNKQSPIQRYELRLLPQPVRRYADPASGLIDGALFFMAYGNNPEVVLVIEARRAGARADPAWAYGLARLGRAELHVSLDGSEVWTQASLVTLSIHDPYMGFTRQLPLEK